MFEITKREHDAVMGIQGIYYSLRTSAEKVAHALRYDHRLVPATRSNFGFVKRLFKSNKELKAALDEKRALLEALTILEAEFEVCMPRIFNNQLYFDFKDFGDRQCSSCRHNLGEAQTEFDLLKCFDELEERIANTLATPEIQEVVANTNNYPYCLVLSKENLGISSIHRAYLSSLQESSTSASTGVGICANANGNTQNSRRKKGKNSLRK